MHGVGPPLVTPFTRDGTIDFPALDGLVDWVEARDVDFIVACGSNSEAELMTAEERERVVETTVEAASVPVIAGTGSPGFAETQSATEAAAAAGADAALVVTPFYFRHDQDALAEYYRHLADTTTIPIYLYSVPTFTDVRLTPDTIAELCDHPNIAGIKDSSGNISELIRTVERTADSEFDPMTGHGGVLAQALDAGATGAVLALSNIAPAHASEIYRTNESDPAAARALNADLVELNHMVTNEYGIPGLKYAMRSRDAPAGYPRSPHQDVHDAAKRHLDEVLAVL